MLKSLKKTLRRIIFNKKNNRLLNIINDAHMSTKKIDNVAPAMIESIAFVIPSITAYAGGLTSILRLGSYLSSFGYNVSYICYDNQSPKSLKIAAEKCLRDYKGELLQFCDKHKNYDIVIATDVISMYYARGLSGYKMAFVQDFEPFFYEAGDYCFLARKAYEMGFHMVSLGAWNKYMIQKYIDNSLNLDVLTFPYEEKEYVAVERDYREYKNKRELNLCVYIRETPRRLPGLCQIISKNLTERFANVGKKLNVYYYGDNIGKFQYGKNLGRLNKSQLFDLYKMCDFGMVASYTNISLVPLEMMATGLPIIEFFDGSFQYFFDGEDAFLFDSDYDKLYNQLLEAMDRPTLLIERNERIQQKLRLLSWKNTAREFDEILQNVVK